MIRRRLVAAAPGVLAAFVLTAGTPRPACVVHHHAGDEHEHVHPFGAAENDDASPRRHGSADGGADLEAPEVFPAEHAHWQHPYQWAEAVELLPLVPLAHRLAPLLPVAPPIPLVARARPVARGPPFPV